MSRIAAIVLAAGKSSRLGRPKQLVPYKGKTLLRNAAQAAIFSPADSVTVVLGAFFPLLKREINLLDVTIVKNKNWMTGMGSSLKTGLRHVLAREIQPYDGFLFLTCDQPFVDELLISDLCSKFEHRNQIVAASYAGSVGVPAIIGRAYLEELLQIDDEAGARQILKAHASMLVKVPFKGGDFDIDTSKDLIRLRDFNRWWKNGKSRGRTDDYLHA